MTDDAQLPLHFAPTELFASRLGRQWTVAEFRADAAGPRPGSGAVINLCADRYLFLAGFAAAVSRGRTTLFPPSAARSVVDELASSYPGCTIIDDELARQQLAHRAAVPPVTSADDFIAVIGHTSGSTGKPSAHRKSWSSLKSSTALNAAAIRSRLGNATSRPWIVATVPSQHMYGIELAVLLPLLGGFAVHCAQPLFPADVAAALASVPAPRVLVTTPVHLRSLLQSGITLPEIAVVVSATAPLSRELAVEVEARHATTLLEMFGSTETCVIASRRTAAGEAWLPYRGVALAATPDGTSVSAPWMATPTLLQDRLELRDDGRFIVAGRHSDMVDIAGKRASLAELTQRIAGLPGVRDAMVLQQDEADSLGIRRIAALVVAPGSSPERLLELLRPAVDPLFLPRPLLLVESLPRNSLGKVPRSDALRLLRHDGPGQRRESPG